MLVEIRTRSRNATGPLPGPVEGIVTKRGSPRYHLRNLLLPVSRCSRPCWLGGRRPRYRPFGARRLASLPVPSLIAGRSVNQQRKKAERRAVPQESSVLGRRNKGGTSSTGARLSVGRSP